MTELVAALRAIFEAWNDRRTAEFPRRVLPAHADDARPSARGDNPYGPPPIYVGALGPRLTRATAEDADGLLVMPFGSKRFLHEVTMPAVREGLAAAAATRDDFAVVPEIIVSVESRKPRSRRDPSAACVLRVDACVSARARCAWLGRPAARTQRAVQTGPLGGHGRLIDDDVLHTIAACGSAREIAAHIRDRVAGVSDRICIYQPGPIAVESLAADR